MKTRAEFGNFLKAKREAANITQAEVAEKLGYTSAQFVSNIERGLCAMPLANITVWAETIGVPPALIFRKRALVAMATMEDKFKRGGR
jgi:transcriptional regulator with XRE-family HTH domain